MPKTLNRDSVRCAVEVELGANPNDLYRRTTQAIRDRLIEQRTAFVVGVLERIAT